MIHAWHNGTHTNSHIHAMFGAHSRVPALSPTKNPRSIHNNQNIFSVKSMKKQDFPRGMKTLKRVKEKLPK